MMGEQQRLTTLCGCLKHERRRYVLYCLEKEGERLSLDALAEHVADRENDGTEPNEGTAKQDAIIELHHSHLPRLAAADLVRYDHEAMRVELEEYPAELIDEDALAVD